MKPKVAVIGLDGATFTLMKPWAERGLLPNFAEILHKGSSGVLESAVPPVTPTAWSSFYTGVNPGKHSVFSFTRFNPETKRRELSNSRVMGTKKFWKILNEHGIRTGLLNLPLTYPRDALDGYMVTGMMTPSTAEHFTYPVSLTSDLESLEKPYIIDVPVSPADANDTGTVELVRKAMWGRLAAFQHLLKKDPCDFVMTVIVAPDRLQHLYWKYIDENSALYKTSQAENFRGEIIKCFCELDDILGEMMTLLGDDCQVIIVSDHGFCELRSEFFINVWLTQKGYLAISSSKKQLLGIGYRFLMNSKRIEKFLTSPRGSLLRERNLKKIINWKNTSAYGWEQSISFDINGREKNGTVAPGGEFESIRQEVAEKLMEMVDPHTGMKVVDSIAYKEDIYSGPYLEYGPDMIPVLDNYSCFVHDGSFFRKEMFRDRTNDPSGTHRPDGISMAYGPNIMSNNSIVGARIIDVTPPVLYAMGLPVPDHMDGKVLSGIFEADYLKSNPVRTSSGDEGNFEVRDEVYSQEEEDAIREQLRGMSYLS